MSVYLVAFQLDEDNLENLGTASDTIVLDDSSTFAVYDIDDLENNLLNDITFSGGDPSDSNDGH